MWYLTSESDKRVIFVLPDINIIIGRSADAQNCNFAIPEDQSISRKHATLFISDNTLYVKDLGSKYGTYVNNSEKIEENVMIKLNSTDVVKFGKISCVWKVQEINFVTCTSTLKGENLQNLKVLLAKLGGSLKNEWDDTCAYLTMPAITLTIKVVLALVQSSNIVTVKYWSKCLEAATDNNPLPNASDFIPQILESTLNKENVSFLPNKERSSIFAGKVVIFFSRRQLDMYKMVLTKSSATPLLLSESKMTKSALCEDNVIVIQYNLSFAGQDTQSQKDQIQEITNYLKSKGKRVVADAEIGLAILFCSTRKYCNPDFNFSSEVIKQVPNQNAPKNILVQESQESSQEIYKKENVLIDESLTLKHNSSNNDSIVTTKRKLSEGDNSDTFNMNKKLAVETVTNKNTTNKRPGEDMNESKPSKKMALDNDDDDDNIFNFLKPVVAKDNNDGNLNKKLNLSKPLKRKHSTDMDEGDLFNFVDKGSKKPAVENDNAGSNILDLYDDDENIAPINKPKTIIEEKVDIKSLRGSKLEELMKINADIPCNMNIKKEDMSDLDSKFSNIDLGSITVVVKTDLIVKKEPLEIRSPQSGVKNFKKFKKVWPIKTQVTIVPQSSVNNANTDSNMAGETTVNA
ncbi:nibrin [Maniola hyperantus]|uniref:nibrin n=1 Tax=Aphantopus hyperantus TaxID=2795564 RepID=UPI001567DE97|nr:nibrin [Maniola hyperantus]